MLIELNMYVPVAFVTSDGLVEVGGVVVDGVIELWV